MKKTSNTIKETLYLNSEGKTMITQSRQFLKIFLVVIIFASLLFACSNGDKSDNSDSFDLSGRQSEFLSADANIMAESLYAEDVASPSVRDEAKREIEEADIVEIDGTNLFILNAYRGLAVCDVSLPDHPSITGRCPINGDPIEMYIRNEKAYVIVSVPQTLLLTEGEAAQTIAPYSSETRSRIEVIDIADTSNPRIEKTMDLEGLITDSRIVGDILYAVSSETTLFYDYMVQPADGASAATVDITEPISSNVANVYVTSIDLSDSGNVTEVDRVDFGGSARYIHVTETAIFIASDSIYYSTDLMHITYVDISDPAGDIQKRGEFDVQGTIQDEFKMDYDSGYFRVCTYQWDVENWGVSRLYVFDVSDPDAAVAVGSLELGKGEQLFATRFDGDKAYMVTFERVDPLWVIDLSDPANPEIKGELEVPGWSTYIQAMDDHLVALGVDDTEGQRRVSVSLFDVTDPGAPALTDRVSFGGNDGWSWTEATQDVKAFTVLEDMGLILLPYSTSSYSNGYYQTENRLQLIDYSPDDLTARGWVTQKGNVLRGRDYSDRLFSVSTEQLQVIDASDRDNPSVSADLSLAENVIDFMLIDNGFGVKVTESGGTYTLHSVDADSPEENIGEIALDDFSYTSHFVNGNFVYVVESRFGRTYLEEDVNTDIAVDPNEYTTRIVVFDFTTPETPLRRGDLWIQGYYDRPVYIEDSFVRYPYVYSREIVQVRDDLLAFVMIDTYDNYDDVVQIADLSNPDNPALVATYTVEEDNAKSFFAGSGVLFYSYTVGAEDDEQGRSQIKYYLGRIDLADPSNPETLPEINIPGICLGMDEAGVIAYTIDNQWLPETESDVAHTFNAVRIEGDTAYLMGETTLQEEYHSFMITDGMAYLSGSAWWYHDLDMAIIDLADPENLEQYDTNLPWYVTNIIGAKERTAFFSLQSGTGCYDVQDPGNPELIDFRYGYTYNNRVVFSSDKAFLPLGHYGLWVKALIP